MLFIEMKHLSTAKSVSKIPRRVMTEYKIGSLTYPLWTSLVDDRQLRLAPVESPLIIFLVPYQIPPKLSVGIFSHYSINRLDQWIPAAFLRCRRLPIVLTHFCETNKPARLDILFYGTIGLTSGFARLGTLSRSFQGVFAGGGRSSALFSRLRLFGVFERRFASDGLPVGFKNLSGTTLT